MTLSLLERYEEARKAFTDYTEAFDEWSAFVIASDRLVARLRDRDGLRDELAKHRTQYVIGCGKCSCGWEGREYEIAEHLTTETLSWLTREGD